MARVNDISQRGFRVLAGIILIFALALRLAGARGDLGQDEITSLNLANSVARIDQVFWKINYDNNHLLNSAWLYIVGPDAPFLAMRALSIACGVASVLAIGLWGARRSRVTGIIAMLLMATSYLMVNYQSEARGYSGMILCTILFAMNVEDSLHGIQRRWKLALYAFIGALFHYDMAMSVCVSAIACFWIVWQRSARFSVAFDTTVKIFVLPGLCLALAIVPAFLSHYTVGHLDPFNLHDLIGADDLGMQTAINIPGLFFNYSDLLCAAILALAWFIPNRADFKASFALAAIILLPVLFFAFNVPNTNVARHFLAGGLAYIVLISCIADRFWQRNKTARIAVCAVLLAITISNGILLKKFLDAGRGHYSAAVAAIDGPYTIDQPQLTPMIDFYSARQHKDAPEFIPLAAWCDKGPPLYLIKTWVIGSAPVPDTVDEGPEGCQAHYFSQQTFAAWGLTGANWVLFKRQ